MTPIRLVAVDLDGTLLDDAGRIPPRNRQALRRVLALGVRVVAATGRPPRGARAALAGADGQLANLPVVALNGARVVLAGREYPLAPMAVEAAGPLLEWAQAAGWETRLYRSNRVWTTIPMGPAVRKMVAAQGLEVQEVANLRTALDGPLDKAVLQVPAARLPQVQAALQKRWGHTLNVSASDAGTVEVTSRAADKGRALAWLARRWGIAPEEVLAVGNERNDLGMVRWAGVGLAVANAHPELLAVARYRVPSNNEAGVAAALDRWLPPAGEQHPQV